MEQKYSANNIQVIEEPKGSVIIQNNGIHTNEELNLDLIMNQMRDLFAEVQDELAKKEVEDNISCISLEMHKAKPNESIVQKAVDILKQLAEPLGFASSVVTLGQYIKELLDMLS